MKWLVLLLLLPYVCCSDLPPGPDGGGLRLSLQDVSCTEAWLRLSVSPNTQGQAIDLVRDGVRVSQIHLFSSDTMIIDGGLLPRHSYIYQAHRLRSILPIESTPDVPVITMDTTSHNFTWETVTLGDGSSSILYDVAIVNDTLAYAVGEIYLRDSTGQLDPNVYNFVCWNGHQWELLRISFLDFCEQSTTHPYPARAVIAFSTTEILLSSGSQSVWWDGAHQSTPICMPVSVNKFWGESKNSIYGVGYGGSIAHYNGNTWQKLESGTALPIWDIWGANDRVTGKETILCVASNPFSPPVGSALLRIQGTSVTELSSTGLSWDLSSLWFAPERIYYVVGAGVHHKRSLSEPGWQRYSPGEVTNYASSSVRGNAINDVFVVGSFGEVVHFNGVSWHQYGGIVPLANGAYSKVAVKGDLVIAVGYTPSQAVILIGRRIS